MDEITKSYLLATDELNLLVATSYSMNNVEDITTRIARITDDILSLLIGAYRLGIEHASQMLDFELTVDVERMEEAIYLLIDGRDFTDRAFDYLVNEDLLGLQAMVEAEFHRVYNTAILDGVKQYVDHGNFGAVKTWVTVGDEKVRDTHAYLEGVSVPVEDEFFTYDGDHAACPGAFRKASNNCGCRCHLSVLPI